MSIEPIIESTKGDDTQNKDSVWWGKVTHIELPIPKSKPKPKTPSPPVSQTPPSASSPPASSPPPVPSNSFEDLVDIEIQDTILGKPQSIGQIYAAFGGSAKSPYKPQDIRNSLARLVASGKISQTNDLYEVIK